MFQFVIILRLFMFSSRRIGIQLELLLVTHIKGEERNGNGYIYVYFFERIPIIEGESSNQLGMVIRHVLKRVLLGLVHCQKKFQN